MGRGRQKAKQTKVARELKYFSPDTNYRALERELGSNGHPEPERRTSVLADDGSAPPVASWERAGEGAHLLDLSPPRPGAPLAPGGRRATRPAGVGWTLPRPGPREAGGLSGLGPRRLRPGTPR